MPAELAGLPVGTDVIGAHGNWIATEKIDGESATVINDAGRIRACGRNREFERGHAKLWALRDNWPQWAIDIATRGHLRAQR